MQQDEMMGIKLTRRERRALAREQGVPFEPQYNGPVFTQAEYEKTKLKFKQQNEPKSETTD